MYDAQNDYGMARETIYSATRQPVPTWKGGVAIEAFIQDRHDM